MPKPSSNIHLPVLIAGPNKFNPPILPEKFVWTSSSLKEFRACKRRFFWKYLYRLVLKGRPGALILGSSFHSCVAEWYLNPTRPMDKIAKKYVDEMMEDLEAGADWYDEDEYGKIKAQITGFRGMMRAYESVYVKDRKVWKGLTAEKEFMVDLQTHLYAGKVDLIVPGKKDRVSIGEHKTTFRIDDTYVERLSLDTQIRGYVFGAEQGMGLRVSDVIYDVVRKSNLRRKANEHIDEFAKRVEEDYDARPAWYFYRENLKFSHADVNAFELALNQTNAEYNAIIRNTDAKNPHSWTPNDAMCKQYNRMCPYFQLCANGLDAGNARMFEQKDVLHEELTGPEETE